MVYEQENWSVTVILWKFKGMIQNNMMRLKALSHGTIFFATCNAILLLLDVELANTRFHHSLLTYS